MVRFGEIRSDPVRFGKLQDRLKHCDRLIAACPGTQSEEAGKVSACQGCPNQKICASGASAAPNPGLLLKIQATKLTLS